MVARRSDYVRALQQPAGRYRAGLVCRLTWPSPRAAMSALFLVFAVAAQALVALFQQRVDGQGLQFVQLVQQHGLQADRHRARVAVRAAGGFADDLVDQSEFLEARRGQAQRFRGVLGAAGVLPKDRLAALRRNHRIGRVLQHVDAVTDTNRERAAGTALADHGAHDRHLQLRHDLEIARDGFALAALFGADTGIRTGCIDEGEDRQAEAFGHLHQAQRLAVALRTRHAEIATDFRFDVAALLVPDHHHRSSDDACQAAYDGRVVGIHPVASEFVKLVADHRDVIVGVRAPRVARQLRDLPGREVPEDFGGFDAELRAQLADLVVHVDGVVVAGRGQPAQLVFQLGDRLLEIEEIGVHSHCLIGQSRDYSGGSFAV